MQYQISVGEDRSGVRAARVDIVDTPSTSPGSMTWNMLEDELRETLSKSTVTMVGFDLSRLERLHPREAFSLFEIAESLRTGYDITFIGPGPGLARLNDRHEGPRLSPVIDPDAWDEHFGSRGPDVDDEIFLVDLDDELRHIEEQCDPRDDHRVPHGLEFVHDAGTPAPSATADVDTGLDVRSEILSPALVEVADLSRAGDPDNSIERESGDVHPDPECDPNAEALSASARSPVVWESVIEALLDHGRRAARAPVARDLEAPPAPRELEGVARLLVGPESCDDFTALRQAWRGMLERMILEREFDLEAVWEFAARLVADGERIAVALPRWLTSNRRGLGEERLLALGIVAATLGREEASGVRRATDLRHATLAALLEHHPEFTLDRAAVENPERNRVQRLQASAERLGLRADLAVEFREHDLSLWRAARRIAGRPFSAPADWSCAVEETLRSFPAPDEARRAVARIVEASGLHLRGTLLELSDGRIAGVVDSVPGRPDRPRVIVLARRKGDAFELCVPRVVALDSDGVDEIVLAHRYAAS